MRLYVEAMDAILVEVAPDGRVRLDGEDWSTPTLQERRAIIHSALGQIAELQELLDLLQTTAPPGRETDATGDQRGKV